MTNHLSTLRARYTVPYICRALNISRNTWQNLKTGRTPLQQEQIQAIMRAIETRYIIIDTVNDTTLTAPPVDTFLEASALISQYEEYDKTSRTYKPGKYQIRTVYNN